MKNVKKNESFTKKSDDKFDRAGEKGSKDVAAKNTDKTHASADQTKGHSPAKKNFSK